jgi:hypothetical protein
MKMIKMLNEQFEGQGVYLIDPYGLKDVEGVTYYAVSFGGSYWPNVYVSPTESYGHEEDFWQAIQNACLTPEGASYRITIDEDGRIIQDGDVLDFVTEDDLNWSEEGFYIYMQDVEYFQQVDISDFQICEDQEDEEA